MKITEKLLVLANKPKHHKHTNRSNIHKPMPSAAKPSPVSNKPSHFTSKVKKGEAGQAINRHSPLNNKPKKSPLTDKKPRNTDNKVKVDPDKNDEKLITKKTIDAMRINIEDNLKSKNLNKSHIKIFKHMLLNLKHMIHSYPN